MTLIDTTIINQTSPYHVRLIDDGLSLGFTTSFGVSYKVGFAEDDNIFERNAFTFYVGAESKPLGKDRKIADTVYSILGSFFANPENILLYFCDVNDHRQALRDRLFNMWYENYPDRGSFEKITEKIEIETNVYFVSIIVSTLHPDLPSIRNQFISYVGYLKKK